MSIITYSTAFLFVVMYLWYYVLMFACIVSLSMSA